MSTKVTLKEIKLSPNISEHDIEYRVRQAVAFISKGNRVKITLQFRGREIVHNYIGELTVLRFIELCMREVMVIAEGIKSEGKRITVILRPAGRKEKK